MGAENDLSIRKDCGFCVPASGERPHFDRFGVGRLDMIPIITTENIIVNPDVMPVSPDGLHLLMIPKGHGYSFAARPELTAEVGGIIKTLEEGLNARFAFFEHGGIKEGASNQSIYHQHAHLITTGAYDILKYMSDILANLGIEHNVVDLEDSSPVANLQRLFKGHDYLYVQQGRSAIIAHDGITGFPSQIAQKSMGRLLCQEAVNWKEIPNNDFFARESIRRIFNLLEKCRIDGLT